MIITLCALFGVACCAIAAARKIYMEVGNCKTQLEFQDMLAKEEKDRNDDDEYVIIRSPGQPAMVIFAYD